MKLRDEAQASFLAALRRRRRGVWLQMGSLCLLVATLVGFVLFWEAEEFFSSLGRFSASGPALRLLAVLCGFGPSLVLALGVTRSLTGIVVLDRSDRWVEELVAKGADRASLEAEIKTW